MNRFPLHGRRLLEDARPIRYNRRKYPAIGQKSLTIRCASGCDRCRGTRRFLVQRRPGTLSRFASVASILGSADKVTDEPSTMTASGPDADLPQRQLYVRCSRVERTRYAQREVFWV